MLLCSALPPQYCSPSPLMERSGRATSTEILHQKNGSLVPPAANAFLKIDRNCSHLQKGQSSLVITTHQLALISCSIAPCIHYLCGAQLTTLEGCPANSSSPKAAVTRAGSSRHSRFVHGLSSQQSSPDCAEMLLPRTAALDGSQTPSTSHPVGSQ